MSGSTENRTSGASGKSDGVPAAFTWSAAARMLPLVGRVIADLVGRQASLEKAQLEKDGLDRLRRTLAWPERSRRYQLQEEIAHAERELQSALAELEVLNVALIDPQRGQVGFPTIVNDREAYFSWCPGEEGLLWWHFAGDTARRPIPTAWTKPADPQPARRRSSRSEPRS